MDLISKKDLKKYNSACEEILTSMRIENLCTEKKEKNYFLFLYKFDVFECYPKDYELITSTSLEKFKFKSQFEFKNSGGNPLFKKGYPIRHKFEIKHPKIIEGIKKIVNCLIEKDAILIKFDIEDFLISGDNVFLVRFHNVKKFLLMNHEEVAKIKNSLSLGKKNSFDTRTAVKIMRCNACHKRMELDLTDIIEKPFKKDYTHYICPYCGEKKSLTELIKIYKENKRNSYYWVFESIWTGQEILQLF